MLSFTFYHLIDEFKDSQVGFSIDRSFLAKCLKGIVKLKFLLVEGKSGF